MVMRVLDCSAEGGTVLSESSVDDSFLWLYSAQHCTENTIPVPRANRLAQGHGGVQAVICPLSAPQSFPPKLPRETKKLEKSMLAVVV